MRKLCFLAVLCAIGGTSFGAPWSVLDENVLNHKKPTKSLSKLAEKTLLPQLLARREPLRYCIEGVPKARQYASALEQGYNAWSAFTARLIRQENRAEEFADLLPFLEKPFLFKRQFCSYNRQVEDRFHPRLEESYWDTTAFPEEEQLRLILLPQAHMDHICSGGSSVGNSVACTTVLDGGLRVIVMPLAEETTPDVWRSSFLHEVGHTLGMGEGYSVGAAKNSPLFGTKANRPSVMQAVNDSAGLTCDDADAFIVLADSLSIPGKPARGGKTARTFQSLCAGDPIWYVDGHQQNRPPRAAGDATGFAETSYNAAGKVSRFAQYAPNPKGFAFAMRLFDAGLTRQPSSATGDMAYYPADDGRTFVVENLETPTVKRVFTLQDKHLLGQTFLDFSNTGSIYASTTLNLQKRNSRLVRSEAVHRQNNPDYGPYFVYAVFEGVVNEGVLSNMSARMAYVFKNWMIVNLMEAGRAKTTTFLLEKDSSGRGQRIQVFQADFEKELPGGSFLLNLTDAKPQGPLSERDKKYLENFWSASAEGAPAELSDVGKTAVTQLGKRSAEKSITVQNLSAWVSQALDLHSKAGRAVKNQFDGGLAPAGSPGNAFAEFQTLFRPAPFVPSGKSIRLR